MNDAKKDEFVAAGEPVERAPLKQVGLSVLAGWLVPGLGHYLAGQQRAGVALAVLVGGLFATGLFISNFEAVSSELHPYGFWIQAWVGGGFLPMALLDPNADLVLQGRQSVHSYGMVPRFADAGFLFTVIAGFLNALVLFDLVERQLGGPMRRRSAEEDAEDDDAPATEGAAG